MSDNKSSSSNFIEFINDNFSLVIIILAVFVGGFLAGSMWKENQSEKQAVVQEQPEVKAADNAQGPQGPSEEKMKNMPEVTEADHIRGSVDAPVIIVEYSDYECPYCNRFHPTMKQLLEEYGDQVAWVYRHLPLSFHANAQDLAEMAECVDKYGGNDKFWEFSDILYEQIAEDSAAAELENGYNIVAEIGVSKDLVQACVANGEFEEKVNAQAKGARDSGVTGTPGSIAVSADGEYKFVAGAQPYSSLKAIVDGLL